MNEWERWFAWHPVWARGHGPVWLGVVERKFIIKRRRVTPTVVGDFRSTVYRLVRDY